MARGPIGGRVRQRGPIVAGGPIGGQAVIRERPDSGQARKVAPVRQKGPIVAEPVRKAKSVARSVRKARREARPEERPDDE